MKSKSKFLAVIALLLASVGPVAAATSLIDSEAAVSFPRAGVGGIGVANYTVGWAFTLDSDRTLTHLGTYILTNEGVTLYDRKIAVWDAAGDLVADATLPAGYGDSELDTGLNANFRYVGLDATVVLQADELYTIGAWYPGDSAPGVVLNAKWDGTSYDDGAPVTTIDGFNMEGYSLLDASGAFAQPTLDLSESYVYGFFGPNLRLSTIPEPSRPALLGLGGLALMLRRRK
jgi:hypothetical protein